MWKALLNPQRLGKKEGDSGDPRSAFQRDFDRVVFSSAFRRLQDKTQVFPLPSSDYVRTRLTHSLEVSSIGRSLGAMVGAVIKKRHEKELAEIETADFGAIVAAACLAHDIGNPPFGHSGESAIRYWFSSASRAKEALSNISKREAQDFLNFEGNAQGLRVLSKLQAPDNVGGLQLTYSTLGAFLKYPREATLPGEAMPSKGQSTSKNGFFQSERAHVVTLAGGMGLVQRNKFPIAWARHPMAFLVEAADDISYRIIDFEDGFRLGHVPYQVAAESLLDVLREQNRVDVAGKLKSIASEKDKIEYIRARVINELIHEVVKVFLDLEGEILSGKFDEELVSQIPKAAAVRNIRKLSKEQVYSVRDVIEIEAAGFDVLGGLLDYFVPAVQEAGKENRDKRNAKYFELLPPRARTLYGNQNANPYERLLIATDFISGMTDSYAVSLYKTVKGISIRTS
jgi:dGTPase